MRHADVRIQSIGELVTALRRHAKARQLMWFRGQPKKQWRLVPSLARKADDLKAEQALLKRFNQNAFPLLSDRPSKEWEWVFLMQHHRAPTRLLDWTESPLAALYFAVSEYPKVDGAVWCLDPIALNKVANLKFSFELELPSFEDKELENYLPSRISAGSADLSPIAVIGPRSSPRMAAQLGVFTVNHRKHAPIELAGTGDHVWRYIVPATRKKRLLAELNLLSYSRLTLFPELDEVAQLAKKELLR